MDGFSRDLGVEVADPYTNHSLLFCSPLLWLDGFWYNKTLKSPPRRQIFFCFYYSINIYHYNSSVQPHHLLTPRLFPLQALTITQLYFTLISITTIIMPARSEAYTVSMPLSPPPPQNLSSYARFMHAHTKRQMEASGARSPPNGSTPRFAASSSMTNGTSTSPTQYQ